jgi:D-alanyl-D-alanine carboxypeptidase (penicillin-binding protein 5/6)
MNANTGEILFKNNPREKLLPASLTKMMVTLVSIDAVRHGYVHLEDPVTVSEEARWVGGSRIYLRPGEILSLEELLEAVLIKSANDAAIAVAEHIGGTQENFVQMMNVYTHRLGMIDTFFVNVHGLPSPDGQDNISSAYDMAILARELIKSRKVLEWSSKPSTKIRSGRYKITTTNKLLKSFHGLDGLKTGYYRRAGFNIAATAKREDLRLIAVTMGSPSSRARFNATKTLLEAGFNYYQSKLNTPKKVDDVNKVNKPRKVPELKRTGEPKKIKESKKLKEPKGVKESKRLSGKTKGGRTNQVLNSLRGLT